MITYLVRRRHRYTIDLFLSTYGDRLPFDFEPLAYEHALRARRLPAGTFVFSDLDRLGPEEQRRAATLWQALARTPGRQLLNHPIRVRRRFELLRTLYERGLNDFDAVRLTEARPPKRFPVFLRAELGHEGSLSDLLHTPDELATAIDTLATQGVGREALLAIEYNGAADASGLHRKYAAFRVGAHILPRHLFFDRNWMVKTPEILDEALVQEELRYVKENPHREELREIFEAARIDYGRIDYAVVDGRVQTFEINTNPMTVGDEGLRAQSSEVQDRFAESFIEALAEIDTSGARRAMVEIPQPGGRRSRAREWALDHLSDPFHWTGLGGLEPRVRMALYRRHWQRQTLGNEVGARASSAPRRPRSTPSRKPVAARNESQTEIDFLASMRAVRSEHGKPALSQLAEIAALALTGNRIAPLDYYRYQLYDDSQHDWAAKRRFVGDRRCTDTALRVVNRSWWALVTDKLASAAFLERHGLPLPAIRAVHHPLRTHPDAAHLPTDAALAGWLRSDAAFPLFAKPLRGFQSHGVFWLERLDPERDELVMRGGARIAVDAFVARLQPTLAALRPDFPAHGPAYLFEEVVVQHPEVVERCGDGVGCVRAMVGVESGGVRPLEWIWKIPAPQQPADNYWRAGNLLAALDPETGEVLRLVRGSGVDLESFADNPYTGRRLVGWRLPGFPALREAVLRGAALLPEVRLQSWDVAVGPEGPIVVEVNLAGSHSLPQIATGRGFWTEETRAFLRRAERENPTRPQGLGRLRWTGHPLRRLNGVWRLLRGLARSR